MNKFALLMIILPSLAYSQTSLELRQEKERWAAVGAGVTYSELSTSLSVGYSYLKDTKLFFEVVDFSEPEERTSAFSYGINARQFLGNSFSIKASLASRYIKDRTSYFHRKSETDEWHETTNLEFQYSDLVADLSVGNHWTFSKPDLTLGVDWFGYGRRIAQISNTSSIRFKKEGFNVKKAEQWFSNNKGENYENLLKLYVGYRF